MVARLVFSLLTVHLGKRFNVILNISTFYNVDVNYAIYLTLAFVKNLFLTRYTININNARRVCHKASKSFFREIFRCIFTDRDFLTVYRAFPRNFVI